jgi:hypothetical protein
LPFTEACIWSKRTVEIVSSCPATEEATQIAASIKKCEGLSFSQTCTKPSKFKYHCLFSYPLRHFVEVCAEETSVAGKNVQIKFILSLCQLKYAKV